eukprot:1142656-Pelagomonas_calceolata.AAC.8
MPCSFVLALPCVLFEGLMHIGTAEQAEQPNYLAEGQTPLSPLQGYKVAMGFDLQPGSLAARLAGLCQPNRKYPRLQGKKTIVFISLLLRVMKEVLRSCLGIVQEV